MLPPHELKTKKFTKALRGYAPEEVDDQIDFLIEQYAELYRENDELERKLRVALANVDSYKKDEEALRSAMMNAQKAADKLLSEASERAEILMSSAKETCDEMIAATASAIKEQMALLAMLRAQSAAFRAHLTEIYQGQLAMIEQNATSDRDLDLPEYADEEIVKQIVLGIKDKAAKKSVKSTPDPLPSRKKSRPGTIWSREQAANESTTAVVPVPIPPEKTEAPSEETPAPSPEQIPQALPDKEEPIEEPAPTPDEIQPAPTDAGNE